MSSPAYLMWFDDDPKLSLIAKIEDAVAAFTRRFKVAPNVVLLSETDSTRLDEATRMAKEHGVALRSSSMVRRNNFWVGLERETN